MRFASIFAATILTVATGSFGAPSPAAIPANAGISASASGSSSATSSSTFAVRPSTSSSDSAEKVFSSQDASLKFVSRSPGSNPKGNPKAGNRAPLSSASASASSSSKTRSSISSTSTSSAPSSTPSPSNDNDDSGSSFWVGANSYYLFALQDDDRAAVLDALSGAGMKTVRIFITHVQQNNKNSGNDEVPDLEQWGVGTYDDTILNKVDILMKECSDRGMKLIIALGDRYALGFWDTDAYAYKYGIVSGGSGAQMISDASNFYTNKDAIYNYDQRIKHILNHKNKQMGGTAWKDLSSVVYAFEAQNEPQGHMGLASSNWNCGRAGVIRNEISSSIKITTGGGITTQTSLADWAWNCDAFDIISVHDYGTNAWTTVNALQNAQSKASKYGKTIVFEEWGALGDNKASTIAAFAQGLKDAGIPWLYWEIIKPGKGSSDFEVWTDEDAWWNAIGNTDVTGAGSSPMKKARRDVQAPAASGVQTRFSKKIKRSHERRQVEAIKAVQGQALSQ